MFSQHWYVRQLRERYPGLVIPFDYYDGRSNNLQLLVDANPDRVACFVVTFGNDDHSLDNGYWPYQHGLLTLMEPKSKGLSLEDLLRDNQRLLPRYRPPVAATVRRETFERDILLAYAWPLFQISTVFEKAGAKNEARIFYDRALAIDPEFSEVRN